MASRAIEIVISAKNAMARGLSSAGASLKKFGESATRIASTFIKSFLAMGTAVAGLAVKAIHAFSPQEAAEKSMEAALRAYGDEVEENTKKVREFAAAIQDETGVADENAIARAAKLRMLGVETGQLEAATKATIALKSAGMGEEQAIRAIASARKGDFQMLQSHIRALRTATTEAEKANIVNDFLTKGYAAQKDQLNTVAGQWGQLRGRIGDVWEEIGRAISQNDMLTDALKRAGDKVKAFGETVTQWAESGGMVRLIATARYAFETIRNGFAQASGYAGLAFSAIGDSAETGFNYIRNVLSATVNNWRSQWSYMRELAVAVWEAIKSPLKKGFEPPDTQPMKDAMRDLGSALAGNDELVVKRSIAAMGKIESNKRDHANRMAKIDDWYTDRLTKKVTEAADDAAQEEISIADSRTAQLEKLRDAEADLAENVSRKERDEAKKSAQARISIEQDKLAKLRDIANKTVRMLLDEREQEREIEREREKDQRRAQELMRREARGVQLSRRGADFLDMFRKQQDALGGIGETEDRITNLKAQLEEAKESNKTLGEMKAELETIRDRLARVE